MTGVWEDVSVEVFDDVDDDEDDDDDEVELLDREEGSLGALGITRSTESDFSAAEEVLSEETSFSIGCSEGVRDFSTTTFLVLPILPMRVANPRSFGTLGDLAWTLMLSSSSVVIEAEPSDRMSSESVVVLLSSED